MATPVSEVVKVNWKQLFPWVSLFRTLGLTLHARQVFVGVVAAGLIALGQWLLLGQALLQPSADLSYFPAELFVWPWMPIFDQIWPFLVPGDTAESGEVAVRTLTVWQLTKVLAMLAWGLVIGSLAGGILVRRTAFEFAREESLSLTTAVRFVGRRAWDYLSAPALPLGAIAGFCVVLLLAGFFARWFPGGSYVVSAMWGWVQLAGIGIGILLLAVLAGWPMMIAAVSINGGDGFDALSRGFGFVLDRWRYYGWCAVVMTLYGGICGTLVFVVMRIGEASSLWSLTQGSGLPKVGDLILPTLLPTSGWEFCLNLVGAGLAYSFFWSNMTVIYLVLRKSVDNANMDDIYVEGASQGSDELQALLNPQMPAAGPTLLPIIDPPA